MVADVVLKDEAQLLDRAQQREMIHVLEQTPRQQKPLARGLRGCYRYRLGAVRVVYRVTDEPDIVTILAIGMRRDDEVYKTAMRRA